ncbi:MAG: aminotransferase class V-fold PLP-dependent enzyme [Lachnospiraceae bacterium]|nr:aminotransferase class V-fold PLP-dependent enzyme [Lachnospiraceae bacterium]
MAYFDNAATTYPKPECVYAFMDEFYRKSGGNAGRGEHSMSTSASGLIADTRKKIQMLLHCPAKQVVFTPTATIALNMIIQGIIADGAKNIYISPFEHNAVTRTLHHFEDYNEITVTQLSVEKDLKYDIEKIRYQFDAVKPDLVIVSHASNTIGLVAPVEDIFSLAKKYGATTLVDMAQTAGVVDCNVGLTTFDFAVFAGHKTLYGPTGISGFIMNPAIRLPAVIFGGTGYESANQDMPESIPEKYEMGTLNISGVAGLNAALDWIQRTTIEELKNREAYNRQKLINLLEEYDFIRIVGNEPGCKYVGIVSCLIDEISSDSAGSVFDQQGIALRTGLHCAPLAHQFIGTYPAGTIRFSVNYFTSEQDFEELRNALDYIEENL